MEHHLDLNRVSPPAEHEPVTMRSKVWIVALGYVDTVPCLCICHRIIIFMVCAWFDFSGPIKFGIFAY